MHSNRGDRMDELYHYGVPGMKWGVIKESAKLVGRTVGKAASSPATKRAAYGAFNKAAVRKIGRDTTNKLSKYERDTKNNLRRDSKIQKKVGNLHKNYKKADSRRDLKQYGIKGVKDINNSMSKGKDHSTAVLVHEGKKAVKSMITSIGVRTTASLALTYAVTKGIQYMNRNLPRIEQNHKYDPIDVNFKILD